MSGDRIPEADAGPTLPCDVLDRARSTLVMLQATGSDGSLVAVSDAWLARLGYAREEVVGRPFHDFLAPESRVHAVNEVLPAFVREGRCENVHYRYVRKDGEILEMLASGELTRDSKSGARLALAVLTDVTALRRSERNLKASEERLRSLVEDQTDLVSLVGLEGDLRYVNPAYAAYCGSTPEAMIGRNLYDFVPAEAHGELREHFRRLIETKRPVEIENQVVDANGETRWFAWTNRALVNGEGRPVAIHSVGRDVDRRVEAERRMRESEARYRFLAEHSNDLILLVDQDGRRLYASPASVALLGYTPEETVAMRLEEAIHPDDSERVLSVLRNEPESTTLTYRMRRKDGSYVWVETTGRSVDVERGERRRLVIFRDIQTRMEAEQQLKASEARYRLLADHAADIVFQIDREGVLRYASPACLEILGFAPEELIGTRGLAGAHREDEPRLVVALDTLLAGRLEVLTMICRLRHRDGRWIWVELRCRAQRDPASGRPDGVIGAASDITLRKAIEHELEEANRRLKALAVQDALTGLANRRAFDEALGVECRRARREGSELALVMIDIDRFKTFNDLYGHPAGDACLARVAEALAASVRRASDVVARYGGEEFAAILPDTDAAGAHAIATRMREAVLKLEIPHAGNPRGVVTISAGIVATTVDSGDDRARLVDAADRALYRAKAGGRDRVAAAAA